MASGAYELAVANLHSRLRELVARLDELRDGFDRRRDSRAIFTYVYSMMTAALDAELDSLTLHDPDWIVALADGFAARYFAALRQDDAGQLPEDSAWKVVFDTLRRRTSVLEEAVYPMTAHIVHDLPLALCDAEFDQPDPVAHLSDFDLINRVMQGAMDRIRGQVTRRYSYWVRFLDRMERRYDLVLSDYGIRMSRSEAWYDALRLRDLACREAALDSLERRPADLLRAVQQPRGSSLGWLLAFLRWLAALLRRWPRA
jgi:Family of unknown function (DUF5995)